MTNTGDEKLIKLVEQIGFEKTRDSNEGMGFEKSILLLTISFGKNTTFPYNEWEKNLTHYRYTLVGIQGKKMRLTPIIRTNEVSEVIDWLIAEYSQQATPSVPKTNYKFWYAQDRQVHGNILFVYAIEKGDYLYFPKKSVSHSRKVLKSDMVKTMRLLTDVDIKNILDHEVMDEKSIWHSRIVNLKDTMTNASTYIADIEAEIDMQKQVDEDNIRRKSQIDTHVMPVSALKKGAFVWSFVHNEMVKVKGVHISNPPNKFDYIEFYSKKNHSYTFPIKEGFVDGHIQAPPSVSDRMEIELQKIKMELAA